MYYTIRQMAQMFGVTEHTLRFYTDQGLLPCTRDSGNRRVFDEESVNWMQGIMCLKGCGASIEDIREYCRLCLMEESEENLRARYAIIRKQRKKPISVWRKRRPPQGTWMIKWRTMKPFSQGWRRTTPTRRTRRRKIDLNTGTL